MRCFSYLFILMISGVFLTEPAAAQVLTGLDAPEVVSEVSPAPVSEEKKNPVLSAQALGGFETSDESVRLDAEKLEHDEATGVITASGNVFLVQAGRILRADEMIYNLKTDTAEARGHVVLNEENGNIHYAEHVTFNDKLKDGFVDNLKVYLADESRFSATTGKREEGIRTTMKDAAYTPCAPCKADPEKPPLWQIHASEVVHDEKEKTISYKNPRFEVAGVPVLWAPYFSHPDGSVKQKSGLLPPSAGFKSDLGFFLTNEYYVALAPDKDMTVGVMAMTKESPMLLTEYRQRWENASLEASGGITHSSRIDSVAGVDMRQDEEVRGHVFGEGLWDINEKWRSGVNVAWASDDQYMRQYDFTDDDVLENEIYAERFSGRNYAAGRLLTFQDVRVIERQEDQPEVLPEMVASFIGEPGGVPIVKGRWDLEASLLGLQRSGSDQDMNRFGIKAGWKRRFVSDYGLISTLSTSAQGDVYSTRDRSVATPVSGLDDNVTATRFFPQAHMQTSYPLAKHMERAQAVIEPLVALTVAPNIDINDDIPNEDSQDVQIDAANIFRPDRFPGVDRVEDQSRVTYGIRTGLYGYGGSYGDVFLGQSHRFQEDDNPFPDNSGLNRQDSDIVGQFTGAIGDYYNLNYRFQLASDSFASVRHEVDGNADWGRFSVSSRYLFADALGRTDIEESREQLQASAGYYLNEDWRVRTGATQDLGESPGLRKAYVGLDHFGQCFSWSLMGKKNYTADISGESDTELLFKLGLKNLGGFETSGLRDRQEQD